MTSVAFPSGPHHESECRVLSVECALVLYLYTGTKTL